MIIRGGKPLAGEVRIQGSKNAALPIMAAAVLVSGMCILEGCPQIADVECMCSLLSHIGCRIDRLGDEIRIDASVLTGTELPEKYAAKMRSSVMLMGPLLARCREAGMYYPGGCVIGDRPVDIHLKVFGELGAVCQERNGRIYACTKGLVGKTVRLPFPSVGATENAIMAAVLAEGVTTVENCACEPEICWLCEFLKKAGADIVLRQSDPAKAVIVGGRPLHPCTFKIPADRIVAGTYLCACMASGGEVFLRDAPAGENQALEQTALRMGAVLKTEDSGLLVKMKGQPLSPGILTTACYPGFPTDLQSVMLPVLAVSAGKSYVVEKIFNGRFGVAQQLNRMGAGIRVKERIAEIPGNRKLHGEAVSAGDLRGGAALAVAALCAEGTTIVDHCFYIDRGYEDICRDLAMLGADIEKE